MKRNRYTDLLIGKPKPKIPPVFVTVILELVSSEKQENQHSIDVIYLAVD
jgi:hypothetical protein